MFSIEVSKKTGIKDAEGLDVLHSISDLRISAEGIQTSQFYALEGNPSQDELSTIATEILIDPVIEGFSIKPFEPPEQQDFKDDDTSPDWTILKLFHFGVTDNVGETTLAAIKDTGIGSINHVMTGKKFVVHGRLTFKQIRDICDRVIANPVIESCFIWRK